MHLKSEANDAEQITMDLQDIAYQALQVE
jgi:hypothetical protein